MKRFVEEKSLIDVQRIQQSIVSTFYDDFPKYCANNTELRRLQTLIRQIPRYVGQKLKYSRISPEDRSAEVKQALHLLTNARLVHQVYHTSASGLPLSPSVDSKVFKCLFLDIGLMNRICGLGWEALSNMTQRDLVNEGGLAEQFIGQHLLYRQAYYMDPELHYWVREGGHQNAELDYVVAEEQHIIPIEVKAGKSGTLKSLFLFSGMKNALRSLRFDLNPHSYSTYTHTVSMPNGQQEITTQLISLPLYMVEQTSRILRQRDLGDG